MTRVSRSGQFLLLFLLLKCGTDLWVWSYNDEIDRTQPGKWSPPAKRRWMKVTHQTVYKPQLSPLYWRQVSSTMQWQPTQSCREHLKWSNFPSESCWKHTDKFSHFTYVYIFLSWEPTAGKFFLLFYPMKDMLQWIRQACFLLALFHTGGPSNAFIKHLPLWRVWVFFLWVKL